MNPKKPTNAQVKERIEYNRDVIANTPATSYGSTDYRDENRGLIIRQELSARFMSTLLHDYGTSNISFLECAASACKAADALIMFWASEKAAADGFMYPAK